MTTSEVIQTIIYLSGLGGVVYWVGKWFHALKGAIEAQKTTIDAQQAIIGGMANFMNIADAPKMAERYEAYKKMVDLEKDARLTKIENSMLEDLNIALRSQLQTTVNLKDELEKVEARHGRLRSVYIEAILKLAVHYQLNLLEWEVQKPTTSPQLVKNIEAIMETLPPPPPPPKTPAEIFLAAGVEHSLTQQALEITKGKPK